jgi:ABC-type branched-subunit amino acid transport system permease subunit
VITEGRRPAGGGAVVRWGRGHVRNLRHTFDGAVRAARGWAVDGSFYALLSLGLVVIFGMLGVVNFAHGAQYMMGVFAALLLLDDWASAIGRR